MDEDDDLSIAPNDFNSSEMDNDDHDLSTASNEFVSTKIFSQTMVLQQHSANANDNGIHFVNVIGGRRPSRSRFLRAQLLNLSH
jgi:hypothetical protein